MTPACYGQSGRVAVNVCSGSVKLCEGFARVRVRAYILDALISNATDRLLSRASPNAAQLSQIPAEHRTRGDQVRERARSTTPDLVILDLMLPGLDGLQVCRLLRADSATLPILMLTARDDSHDQVLGLEMGADDYVTKPCEPRVLLARVRTLLRRSSLSEPMTANDRILMGNLCIDLSERTVTWREQLVELSSGEYNLLVVLARHAGEVLSLSLIHI